jgi:replicative DNA helicase
LPHDADAEEAVIGSILIDGEAVAKVSSFLKSGDFYLAKSRWCYEACLSLFERSEAMNQVTVAHELSQRDRLEEVGGSAYLAHLVRSVPTSAHVEHYARIVQRASTMRQLIAVAGDIAAIGYEEDADVEGSLSRAEDLLFQVRTRRGTRDFVHIREVLDAYMEETTQVDSAQDKFLAPIPTGFPDFDKLLGGGLQRSDLVIIAGRPSLGKSTLAFNIARHAAEQGAIVGVFSLEMSAEQIGIRLVSAEADVDSYRLRLGVLSEAEHSRELDAIGMLSELRLYIDDSPIQGVVEMRGKARRLQTERGLDLLIVDYLQLIGGGDTIRRSDNRVQEMGEISRSLKGMARDLDVPVLACSQLSRAVEQRPSHRPILSDLRESGSIEQDADVVAFIYREDMYTTREEWEKRNPSDRYPENIAEIIVSKHRHGPTGQVSLYFRNDVVRFESLQHPVRSRELA